MYSTPTSNLTIAPSGKNSIIEAAARDREMQVSGFPPAAEIFRNELSDNLYNDLNDRLVTE